MPKVSKYATKQCFYCDEKSEEAQTGVIKRKYKLAGRQNHDSFKKLGIRSYIYFVTTTQVWHTPRTTLKIEPHEIKHYVDKPLRRKTAYVDLKYRERIFESDLHAKVADPANKFRKVGKLTEAKWNELCAMAPIIASQSVGSDVKKDVLFSLLDQDVAEGIIQRFGI